MLINTIFDIYW